MKSSLNFGGMCGQMFDIKPQGFLLECNGKYYPIVTLQDLSRGSDGQVVYLNIHMEVDNDFKVSIVADKVHFGYMPETRLPYKD